MKFNFRESRTFDERLNDATKIKRKYPDRIPVCFTRHFRSWENIIILLFNLKFTVFLMFETGVI
ncbi:unnamed protein product [Hymenolepis diminuta]|uniref:Autophagy-related protein n=1 Tax=Hymenolepis diminuta TaxID=6216 RepID=A0A564Z799_HYMDI|nr:unnamed protein product [Hymenolepis diminuta]